MRITATVVLNVVMISSHLPSVFDYMMARPWMMQWIIEPAFLFSGLFFFHFIVSSPPRRITCGFATNWWVSSSPSLRCSYLGDVHVDLHEDAWYTVMAPMWACPRCPAWRRRRLLPSAQQRLAAGILWICGDGWAVPCSLVGFELSSGRARCLPPSSVSRRACRG